MIVNLNVPDTVSFQLVYRMEARELKTVELDQGLCFLMLNSGVEGIRHFKTIATCFGKAGATKAVAKLCTRSRSLYLITRDGVVVSSGWCTIGRCAYYKVEPDSVVIGPIWTSDSVRGRGLATKALQLAMNEHVRRGRSLFYIDTEKKNLAAQRVFEKCGFGAPVALYFR
jgi:predicted GNAT family acetyltransferase